MPYKRQPEYISRAKIRALAKKMEKERLEREKSGEAYSTYSIPTIIQSGRIIKSTRGLGG